MLSLRAVLYPRSRPPFRLCAVSKLYLLLIMLVVLMTLAWIAVLAWAAISLAQHVF
jgi:hypothetical protein